MIKVVHPFDFEQIFCLLAINLLQPRGRHLDGELDEPPRFQASCIGMEGGPSLSSRISRLRGKPTAELVAKSRDFVGEKMLLIVLPSNCFC